MAERFLLEYKKGANRNRRLYRSPIFRRKGPGRDARLKTMGVMLDAAASVGVSLHQLLIDPEASARSMPLEMDGGLERTPKGSADVNRKVTSLRMALEAELQKNTDEPATQILEICKQQGVRVQFSRYWLPALTNQLACRNEKLRSQALHKKYADAEKWVFDIGIPGILKGQWSSAFHAVSELRASKSPIADIVRKQFKAQIEKMPDDEFNRLLVAVKEHWEREKPSAMSQWAAQANKRVERRSSALKEV